MFFTLTQRYLSDFKKEKKLPNEEKKFQREGEVRR